MRESKIKNRNLLIEETFEGFFLPKEGKRDLIHRIASSLGPKGTKVKCHMSFKIESTGFESTFWFEL